MPTRDAWLIGSAAVVRAVIVGAVGVFLAIFLANSGYAVSTIGLLLGVGLTGATVMTAMAGSMADRVGRRRTLIAAAALTALGYAGAAVADGLAWLLPIAFFGMLNGMGRDRGPAGALEQAMLPETTDAGNRTWVMAWYNLALEVAHALGALGAALPALATSAFAISAGTAHRAALLFCAAVAAATIVPYVFLSARVEAMGLPEPGGTAAAIPPDTRHAVRRLAVLFGIDSLGGGLLSSALIAYWFLHRYGLSEGQIGMLFFAARALNALSHPGAAWLARRIGLLNTMVFTHVPSSVLLMSAPLAPTGPLAAALFLSREALVEMDVPTRQSYVMAIVPSRARTYASSITNVTRTGGWAVGAALAGLVMQHVALAGPLFIGGALKIGYDLALYRSFRHVRPPEELSNQESRI